MSKTTTVLVRVYPNDLQRLERLRLWLQGQIERDCSRADTVAYLLDRWTDPTERGYKLTASNAVDVKDQPA